MENQTIMPLLKAEHLTKKYAISVSGFFKKQEFSAVNDVSFDIRKGETFGLVGESGCGKSTLSLLLLKLTGTSSGKIIFEDRDITNLSNHAMQSLRKDMQVVFQDPFDSLDPRLNLHQIMEEPLKLQHIGTPDEREKIISELFDDVGLSRNLMNRYPHQLSGGQRQRLCIARALALSPKFLVLDEAVAALDVSIQSQILNLLLDLKEKKNLTYLFISHNLAVVKFMSDRIGVMYFGRIVELGDKKELFSDILHPYTLALLSAIPRPDPEADIRREILNVGVPSLISPPSGCAFHPRCPYACERCRTEVPLLRDMGNGHLTACHRADEQPWKEVCEEILDPIRRSHETAENTQIPGDITV